MVFNNPSSFKVCVFLTANSSQEKEIMKNSRNFEIFFKQVSFDTYLTCSEKFGLKQYVLQLVYVNNIESRKLVADLMKICSSRLSTRNSNI